MLRTLFLAGLWSCIGSGVIVPSAEANPAAVPIAVSSSPQVDVALVPAKGALLGHYYGAGTIAQTDKRIGRRPQIHLTYFSWEDAWATAPSTRQDLKEGRIPLINWEPFDVEFKDIADGMYDDMVAKRADEAKALGTRFFLDFAAEMNEEEGWGGHDPKLYVQVFRHIHDIFIERGATNVVWVWCPNNVDSPGQPEALRYYPGNRYVDWVGIDGYNWGTSDPDQEWESFYEVFEDLYAKLAATGKPVMIGETASDERGGDKAKWIAEIVPTLRSRFPAVKAMIWFDTDKERHWRIDSSKPSLDAYRRMARDPYFN
ncbi:glycoside hydrolase family 26 protein [Aureimonas sp. AU20]|uniref:glycoside hydrolase family 26 protein n=1 Tax=Aureimonas sp. AU20 TaxID=1349819 RepID=UPI00071F44F3|nr:glycosyl hydrolase [Aureimonas sp. AU20]ALN71874.1 hypothetical protein M673_04050 [Aureimonas sp. AU20]